MKYIIQYIFEQINKIVNKLGKATCLVLVGVFLLFIGFMIYTSRPRVIYNEQGEITSYVMSEDEAKSLIESILSNVLNIYENPTKLFKVKSDNVEEHETEEKAKEEKKDIDPNIYILDYDSIMPKYFTKNGIMEFEEMKFSNKPYYNKNEDGDIFFSTNVILDNNKFTNVSYTITKLIIGETEISCNINFSKLRIDELDEVNYEVYTKKLVLVKEEEDETNKEDENKTYWLVESFNYANKKMIEV